MTRTLNGQQLEQILKRADVLQYSQERSHIKAPQIADSIGEDQILIIGGELGIKEEYLKSALNDMFPTLQSTTALASKYGFELDAKTKHDLIIDHLAKFVPQHLAVEKLNNSLYLDEYKRWRLESGNAQETCKTCRTTAYNGDIGDAIRWRNLAGEKNTILISEILTPERRTERKWLLGTKIEKIPATTVQRAGINYHLCKENTFCLIKAYAPFIPQLEPLLAEIDKVNKEFNITKVIKSTYC